MNIKLVAADLTKWVAYGQCRVVELEGFNNQASGNDRYVFLFEQPTAAAGDGSNISSFWFPAQTTSKYTFGARGLQLSELLVAISTTQISLTAPAAAGGLDLTVVVESDFLVTSATLISGDLTSAVASRQVWASANGFKKLLRLDVKNNSGLNLYAFVQASDASLLADDTTPIIPVADTETKSIFFGRAGYVPLRQDADKTLHKGCTVRMSTVPFIPHILSAGADFNIRAIYE